jgi:hypothetical protein
MSDEEGAGSLLEWLAGVSDHRRRQGRIYPLGSMMGMLVLGALHGEQSLRGMWLWGVGHWRQIWQALGFGWGRRPPALSTVWYALRGLEEGALEGVLGQWVKRQWPETGEQVSVDGKVLRGSRRGGQRALAVVEALAQEMRLVLGQRGVKEGDELGAALEVLRGLELEGKVVTMDAGLMQRRTVEVVLAGGGQYLGPLKGNHPELKPLVDDYIQPEVFPPRPGAGG